MKDPDRLTKWLDPSEKTTGQYGHVTYREWCERERIRMAGHGVHAEIIEQDGRICLRKTQW